MTRWLSLAILFWTTVPYTASAESPSVSYSLWTIDANQVAVRFILPTDETQHIAADNQLIPRTAAIAKYILGHLAVSAAGNPCSAIDQGYDIGRVDILSVPPGLAGFELIFQCPGATRLILHNTAFFEKMPRHIDFARVQKAGAATDQVFTNDCPELSVPDDLQLQAASINGFVKSGFLHVLDGGERICLLLALALSIRRVRDWTVLIISLGVGYAAATIASFASIAPRSGLIDISMGVVIFLIASGLIARQVARPRLLAAICMGVLTLLAVVAAFRLSSAAAVLLLGASMFSACFLRISSGVPGLPVLVLPALFGFLDGFMLKGDFVRLGLLSDLPSNAAIGFNVGALVACAMIAGLSGVAAWVARSRPGGKLGPFVRDLTTAALAGAGTFWLLSGLNV